MKHYFGIILTGMLLAWDCDQHSTEPEVTDTEILMEGMDKVSGGGNLQVVINTQEEYDQLIYIKYTKPLQDYWDANYESVLQSSKARYPNRSDQEYAELVKNVFYSTYPFMGTENIVHPSIDFSKYSLLGQNVDGSGCRTPDYKVSILRDDRMHTLAFKVIIQQYGYCDMAITKNKWMLVRKISDAYTVKFETEYKTANQ